MQVRMGASVFGPDGKRLGEVDGLVVDAGTKRARVILIDAGFLDRARHMVSPSSVTRSDSDGLHLDATAEQTEADPGVLASEEVARPQRVEPPTIFVPAAGVGGPVYADAPPAPGDYPDDHSFFDVAPIDPPPVEIESDLGTNEVILGRGTDVISRDHHKLGDAVAFDLGDREVVETVVVSEGFIFKEQSSFSLDEIDEFGTDEIHLRVTRAEAEAR